MNMYTNQMQFIELSVTYSTNIIMPPKRISSKSRRVPTPAYQQNKRRRVSTNMEAVATSTPLSPDVLETITREVTERVTATIREELTTLISNVTSSTTATSQGSISNNTSGVSVNNDQGLTNSVICGSESTAPSTSNDQAIQQSVEALVINHTEKIAGKSPSGFVSTAIPIDARVSDQLKSKIRSNQYVDFIKLLSKDKQKKGKFSLQVEDGDSPGKLTIHQVENDSSNDASVSSMHDWLTAWNRFSAIYCMKYTDQQAKLAKHLEAVREIADAKGNWKGYDTDFRMLVAQGQVAWGGCPHGVVCQCQTDNNPDNETKQR
ncbi:uncharacterized protein LOC133174133 [Saccostrea echinata]|uniref:uncharacterized protein LOC133174133 n=1 Tax=Saccostrea echinata TaxID=191078 RepID=UPI002A81978F|nr:uncharacterized protein LOC133174133 [Saccostrea echinata]